ncbi:glycosyltransferase [Vibrio parahaemolyticus]
MTTHQAKQEKQANNISIVTTYGDYFHDRAVYTIKTLPKPVRWYVDSIEYAEKLKQKHSLDVEIVLGQWTIKDRVNPRETTARNRGVSMVVFAMHHLIKENKYSKAVAVDSDIQNLGGVEELFKLDASYQVMCSNSGAFQDIHETKSPSTYGINGGVYLFNLDELRKDVPCCYDSRDFITDEHYFNQLNYDEFVYPTLTEYKGGQTLSNRVGRFSNIYNFCIHDSYIDQSRGSALKARRSAKELLKKAKIIHYMGEKHDRAKILKSRFDEFYKDFVFREHHKKIELDDNLNQEDRFFMTLNMNPE